MISTATNPPLSLNHYHSSKVRTFWAFIAMLFLLLNPFFFSFTYIPVVSRTFSVLSLISILIIIVLMFSKLIKTSFALTGTELLWLYGFVPILMNNFDIRGGAYGWLFSYVIIITFLLISKFDSCWIKPFMSLLVMLGFFYAVCTIWFYFSPDLYLNHVINIFPSKYFYILKYWYNNGFMSGLTTHYSTNGMYLAIACGISFCNIFNENKKGVIKIIFFLVTLVALLLTGKRAHLIFTVMAMFAVYYLYLSDKPKGRLSKIVLVSFILVILVFIASMFIPNVLNAINRFITLSDEGNIDAGRSDLYALAFSLFKTSPLLGVGWGKYKYIYAALNPLDIFTIQVHNVYLQLLCETGIFGFIIFVSAFIASFVFAVRLFVNYRKKKIELPENSSYILMFSLFMQTFFLLYCFTGNPLYDFQMLYPYLISVGIVQYYKFNFIRRNKNAKKIRNNNLPQSS